MNFSPELYRLIFSPKLNFSLSTKKTTEFCFALFFPINKFDEANLNFSPELYRLIFSPKLNFSSSTKKTTEFCFALFFPINKFVFDFCCLCLFSATTRVNMRFSAKNTRDSAQGYIQCMKCNDNPVVRTDGRSRDYYVTTKISWLDRLPNVLSNGAPLTR